MFTRGGRNCARTDGRGLPSGGDAGGVTGSSVFSDLAITQFRTGSRCPANQRRSSVSVALSDRLCVVVWSWGVLCLQGEGSSVRCSSLNSLATSWWSCFRGRVSRVSRLFLASIRRSSWSVARCEVDGPGSLLPFPLRLFSVDLLFPLSVRSPFVSCLSVPLLVFFPSPLPPPLSSSLSPSRSLFFVSSLWRTERVRQGLFRGW